MRYEEPVYRPFSEANSYLLQCTIGCSHNRCTFCGMYKSKKFRIRSLEEIKEDIDLASQHYYYAEKVFLCDGDALALDTDFLIEIIEYLFLKLPRLRHVGTYAGPGGILKKSQSELQRLVASGLNKAYLGVESGDDDVLKFINKGVSAKEMLLAGQKLVSSGMNLSSMVLLGIAGPGEKSEKHAVKTAEITNAMNPRYLAALTYTPVPDTPLYKKYASGEFRLIDPFETIYEMKLMIENIDMDNLKFVGAHASNYLPVSGTLQKDKKNMLENISEILDERDKNRIRSESARGL